MARKGCDVCGADGYSSPSVTVDAVATRVRDGAIEALMIQRGANPPEWKGKWAFQEASLMWARTHLMRFYEN